MTSSSSKPVVILGCGPAGLFAAHGVAQAGGHPLIFSKKAKSQFAGAQYIQEAIPGLADEPDGEIYTYLLGVKERYATRVYGSPDHATSWPDFDKEPEPAWDIRKAYDRAWDLYEGGIVDMEIKPEDVAELTASFPVVISTIPAWSLCECPEDHEFASMQIWTTRTSIIKPPNENYVVYNGTEQGSWYRCARIFGHESTECTNPAHSSSESKLFWTAGYKILGNNCDCHPNLHRTGRLGTWRRGVLTHHAFKAAIELYSERLAV